MSNPNIDRPLKVAPHDPIRVEAATYPWINVQSAEVEARTVELIDHTTFVLASIIGLNNSIRKATREVSKEDSENVRDILLRNLPATLQGQSRSGIGKVNEAKLTGATLFTASRNLRTAPSLIFAIADQRDRRQLPIVVRAGVSRPGETTKLLALMGIKQINHHRRRRA